MKATIQKLDDEAIRREYPIIDHVPGWFFRITEQSPCVWRVEGTDLWGREVSDVGTDEIRVLASCAAMATEINKRLAAKAE